MGQLEETVRVILELRQSIARFQENFEGNEAQTRVSLIDPMLRTLGWDVSNPAEVAQETGRGVGVADYALKDRNSGMPLILVEAKSLNRSLDDAHQQVAAYCYSQNVGHAIVTDGNDWILLEIGHQSTEDETGDEDEFEDYDDDDAEFDVEIPIIEVARFSMSRGDAVVNAIHAQNFGNPASQSLEWDSELGAALKRVSLSGASAPPAHGDTRSHGNQQSFGSLRELNNPPVPSKLHFDDGYVLSIQAPSWPECVRNVAIYLGVIYEELTDEICPISAPRSRTRYVANDRPRHANRQDFGDEYEVGDGVFVELDLNARSGVTAACTLLEECGFDPYSVIVDFDNNP